MLKAPLWGVEKLGEYPLAQVLILSSRAAAEMAQALYAVDGVSNRQVLALALETQLGDTSEVDWSELKGRSIGLWPKAGPEGMAEMRSVAKALCGLAKSIKLIDTPHGVGNGWDLSCALPAGFSILQYARLAAKNFPMSVEDGSRSLGFSVGGGACYSAADTDEGGNPIYDDKNPMPTARDMILRYWFHDDARAIQHFRGTFLCWTGSHYEEREDDAIRSVIYQHLEGAKRWTRVTKRGSPELLLAAYKPCRAKVADVVDALRAVSNIPRSTAVPSWLGRKIGRHSVEEILSCQNGLFHLPSGLLLGHTPEYFCLNSLPFSCDLKAGVPVEWLKFLDAIWPDDPESISALQLMFGYLLTADTRLQKIFLLVGPPRCGKGTILRVIASLLGASNVCAPDLNTLAERFALEDFVGKQAALVGDVRLSPRADQASIAGRLLSISGEDAVSVERKNRTPWVGKLNTRFVIASNLVPSLNDPSGALASRFVVFAMRRSFLDKEDKGLMARLHTEMPAILAWAVEGWRRLQEVGRIESPRSAAADMEELDDLASPIRRFLRERCIMDIGNSSCWVDTKDLYLEWKDWCRENGREHPGTDQAFGRDLRGAQRGIVRSRYRVKSGWAESVCSDDAGLSHEQRRYRYMGIKLRQYSPI